VSFADYLGRMKDGQEHIYVITADSLAAAKASPQLEIFKKKGIEVLLLVDRVDEWMLSHLYEFEGKQLQSVAKGAVDLDKLLDEDEKKAAEATAEGFKPTLEQAEGRPGTAPRTCARPPAWSIPPRASWSRTAT
jgi:molecular chaperone HtpG